LQRLAPDDDLVSVPVREAGAHPRGDLRRNASGQSARAPPQLARAVLAQMEDAVGPGEERTQIRLGDVRELHAVAGRGVGDADDRPAPRHRSTIAADQRSRRSASSAMTTAPARSRASTRAWIVATASSRLAWLRSRGRR